MARRARRSGGSPRPYDATTKYLFELDPLAWLAYAGLSAGGTVQLLDTDLSTVERRVDKVVRVGAPKPWLAHFEFQSGSDPELVSRLLQYNVLLHRQHGGLVESILVLLRPTADSAELSGSFRQERADGTAQLEFRYTVIRVWEQPVEAIFEAGLAMLPLAPLARIAPDELSTVVRRVDQRLRQEAPPDAAERLWTATYWMAGLRYTEASIGPLFQGVRIMRDSSTYQAAVAEGRAEGRTEEGKRVLLLLGGQRFGSPDARTRRALTGLADLARIERMTERLLQASSWDDLLATP